MKLTVSVWLALALKIAVVSSAEDYILLLDSSESFASSNFEKEIGFSIDLVKQLFNDDNRIGLFTFGESTHNQFSLDRYNDLNQLNTAITYMWYSTGNGNIGTAMTEVLEKGFVSANGDRECISNVLIVLTHSTVTQSSLTAQLKATLDEKAIRLFVLNMAGQEEGPGFADLADSADRVFNIGDFIQLQSIVLPLQNKIASDKPRTGCGVLTQWESWTRCSRSCNGGQSFRLRQCVRERQTDKTCDNNLSEATECFIASCTDPVDGSWANWQTWTGCTSSCGSGTQLRNRECSAPIPKNGGQTCPGSDNQVRSCAEWECPDCTKDCPTGSSLTEDCSLCVCASSTLFGRLLDDMTKPVKNASIFLNSRRYEALVQTDHLGVFESSGICISDETVTIEATGHAILQVTPVQVNMTHWIVNATIPTLVAPVFSVQPHDKVRMVGQDLTLCCAAVGQPMPISYKWLKDGVELENFGLDGTMTISPVTFDDAATYKCSAETEAGVSLSAEAVIKVKEQMTDTCGSPLTSYYEMPDGCQRAGDTTNSSSVDVGTCGKASCVTSNLLDNGTCADWWTHHCCDVNESEDIEIICNGFSYTVKRVQSCKCKPCVLRTSISGRVIGKQNETVVPMQFGSVIVNGEEVAQTNMAGFFKFDVKKGTKHLIATYFDKFFKKFLSTTKTVTVNEGTDMYITVNVVIKPDPISFNSNIGRSFVLGDSDKPAAGSLSLQEESLIDSNGNLYIGSAKAYLNFMDPRNMENLATAYGEFVAESPDGEQGSLQTFGIFNLEVQDENGNGLKIDKPVTIRLDSSLYNISVDENGDSDMALWNYDINKGIWVEGARMKFEKTQSTGRHLLQSTGNLVGTIDPSSFPPINHEGTRDVVTTEVTYQWNANGDRWIPVYTEVTTKEDYVEDGACFVSVSVYSGPEFRNPYMIGDVTVTVYTLETSGTAIGKSDSSLTNGHACVQTFCNKIVYIEVVKRDGTKLIPGDHFLPRRYPVENIANDRTRIESVQLGDAANCAGLSASCIGPIYRYDEANICSQRTHDDDSFKFKFAPLIAPPELTNNGNDASTDLSWNPGSEKACFMKIAMQIEGNFNIRMFGMSYLNRGNNKLYGTHNVGFEPHESNQSYRGACMQFRCPGLVFDERIPYMNQPTLIEARILPNSMTCTMRQIAPNLQLDAITNQEGSTVGFTFEAEANNNYGPLFGVYVYERPSSEVEQICNSGSVSTTDGIMDPFNNAALEFTCT